MVSILVFSTILAATTAVQVNQKVAKCHFLSNGQVVFSCNDVSDTWISCDKVCDLEYNCPNKIDEAACTRCPDDGFLCDIQSKKCVSRSSLCNGDRDCPYVQDENSEL